MPLSLSEMGRKARAIPLSLVLVTQALIAAPVLAAGENAHPSMQHVLPETAADKAGQVASTPRDKTPAAAEAKKDYVLEQSPLEMLSRYDGLDNRQAANPLNIPPGDEVAERRVIKAMASQVAIRGPERLDQLEETLSGYLKTNARTASGVPKFGVFFEHFDAEFNQDFEYRHHTDFVLEALAEWEQRHPRSSIVPVMKAMMYANIAKTGSVNSILSSTITDNADHGSYLAKARAALEAAPHAADTNPEWHEVMIEIRAMQSASVDEIMSLVKQATAKFPGEAFPGAATAVLIASKDPARDIEALAVAISEKAPDGSRDETYLRTYMSVLLAHGLPAFQVLAINPERFAAGAREMAAKYPINFVHQRLAMMSCILADKDTSRLMWKEIRQRPIISIWRQPEFFELCRAWNAEQDDRAPRDDEPFEKRELKQREIEN